MNDTSVCGRPPVIEFVNLVIGFGFNREWWICLPVDVVTGKAIGYLCHKGHKIDVPSAFWTAKREVRPSVFDANTMFWIGLPSIVQ